MNKNLTVMIGAMVLLIASVTVIAMGKSVLSGFQDDSTNVKDQGCKYQQRKVISEQADGGTWGGAQIQKRAMNKECDNEDFEEAQKNVEVAYNLN